MKKTKSKGEKQEAPEKPIKDPDGAKKTKRNRTNGRMSEKLKAASGGKKNQRTLIRPRKKKTA